MTGKSGILQKVWSFNFSTHTFWNICDGKNEGKIFPVIFLIRYFKKCEWINWSLILFVKSNFFQSLSWIIWKQINYIFSDKLVHLRKINKNLEFSFLSLWNVEKEHWEFQQPHSAQFGFFDSPDSLCGVWTKMIIM